MFAWRALPRGNGADMIGAARGAYLTVPALESAGIRVAFTTRHGGVSEEPYASLNLAFSSGDDPERVRANRARVLGAVGGGTWTSAQQVHAAGVVRVGPSEAGAGAQPGTALPDADAMWTDRPGIALAIRTADCVPIVLADPSRPAVAVIHAGWRGLVAGVVDATVRSFGGGNGMLAIVGPSIGPCCYEVGDEVAGAVRDAVGEEAVRAAPSARPHADLWRGVTIALRRAGVRDTRLAMLCTRCEHHRFFSHRGGDAGRQGLVASIGGEGAAGERIHRG